MRTPAPAEHFPLWLEHLLPLAVFRRTLTQWYVSGFGQRVGLRYSAARLVFDALGGRPEDWADVLDAVQVMELTALEVWAEQAQQE